jgi:hypothetical protein
LLGPLGLYGGIASCIGGTSLSRVYGRIRGESSGRATSSSSVRSGGAGVNRPDLGEVGKGCCLGSDESLDGKWGFLRIVSDALGVLSYHISLCVSCSLAR